MVAPGPLTGSGCGPSGGPLHIKRYGGSVSLSPLFAQAAVAARLFLSDNQFRRELDRLLPACHHLQDTRSQPRGSDYEVAYAIASKDRGSLLLAFFSRVTCAARISGCGIWGIESH